MTIVLSYDTVSKKEAYLNEFKGNLFEFLVGSYLAQKKGVEGPFLRSFSPVLRNQFSYYELQLKKEDPILAQNISLLAQNMAESLMPYVPSKIDNILVVGKSPGLESWKEADLILIEKNNYTPISLKLSKENSYVNTKSGGVKSFLSKYFSGFNLVDSNQKKLNEAVSKGFWNLGHELHENFGLKFKGNFGEDWKKNVGFYLPSEVPENLRVHLIGFYHQVISSIYKTFIYFEKENPDLFRLSLYSLFGFGLPNMIQAICYHGPTGLKGKGSERYFLKGISIRHYDQMRSEIEGLSIDPLKEDLSSFEINLPSYSFQIRVKPMNKFTVPSLKVNCSIRDKKVKK